MSVDRQLPDKFVQQVLEDQPVRANWNPELEDLFNPSITARPLHLPQSGQIAEILNTEFTYYWARDFCGSNPNHERVEQLRSEGFVNATTKDVVMKVKDNVKSDNEIRSGDRLLMKCPNAIWKSLRKQQNLDAINMSYPQARDSQGKPMSLNSLVPGVRSQLSTDNVDEIRARAIVSDHNEELATGEIKGNASVAKVKGADRG